MVKSKILLIKTGGTIGQKPNAQGINEPSPENYIHKVEGIENLADIEIKDLGNIDSTNMETNLAFTVSAETEKTKDRANVARIIYENSSKYDGFVIAHGTDTMAETAAALTYMLPGFGKPIVLTGSQRSIWMPRSDAPNNLYTAVQAATKDFGEVVISFGNYILRGPRSKKVDEEGYDAFMTPGVEPVGKLTSLSEGIRLANHRVPKRNFTPEIFTDFDTKIFHYAHLSGATIDNVLLAISEHEDVHGIIMSGFGAGNIPDRLLPFISSAIKQGKPVFVYTSCDTGAADMGIYSVGDAPLKAGAKSAGDMTFEALGQKFMYALGMANKKGLNGKDRLNFVDAVVKTQYNGDIMVTERRK